MVTVQGPELGIGGNPAISVLHTELQRPVASRVAEYDESHVLPPFCRERDRGTDSATDVLQQTARGLLNDFGGLIQHDAGDGEAGLLRALGIDAISNSVGCSTGISAALTE